MMFVQYAGIHAAQLERSDEHSQKRGSEFSKIYVAYFLLF